MAISPAIVIVSEAKQSSAALVALDCFVASLLAMTHARINNTKVSCSTQVSYSLALAGRHRRREMLVEEGEHLLPGVVGLLLPVAGRVPVEEAVPGAVITMEFVGLAHLLE